MDSATTKKPAPTAPAPGPTGANEYVGVIQSLRGLMVEVQILGEHPDGKELLNVEGLTGISLEVSYFKAGMAVCINLANTQGLRCGMKVSRSHTKVTVPVGPATMGRVFNALGEPLDEAEPVMAAPRATAVAKSSNYWRPASKSSTS